MCRWTKGEEKTRAQGRANIKFLLKLFSKSLQGVGQRPTTLPLPLVGGSLKKARETGAFGPAFPGPQRTRKVAFRKLGSKASACPLSRLTAPAPPRGEPSLASPFGGGAPAGGGEGNPPPARTCAILSMSTSGSELPKARIDSPGTGPRTCAILLMSTSGSELPLARLESPGTGPPGPKMGK